MDPRLSSAHTSPTLLRPRGGLSGAPAAPSPQNLPTPAAGRTNLQPLTEAWFAAVTAFLDAAPPVSQYRLPILYGYSKLDAPRVQIHEGLILIETRGGAGCSLYAAGSGRLSASHCARISRWQTCHPQGRVYLAEPCLPGEADCDGRFLPQEAAALHNYVLSVEHMLAGDSAGIRRKQRAWQRFQQAHPAARIERLDLHLGPQAAMLERFFQRLAAESEAGSPSLSQDTDAFRRCLGRAEDLEVEVLAVVAEGEMLAVQAFEFPRGTCFFSSYCRSLKSIPQLYDYFDISVAEQARRRGYTLYNIGEDLGLPNLRRGKLGWEPAQMVRLFELTRRAGAAA